ncbi:hypothetical protein ACHAXS_003537 [Conticribra weissflogii]
MLTSAMLAPFSILSELLAGYFVVITLVAGFPVADALVRNSKSERNQGKAACLEDDAKLGNLDGEKNATEDFNKGNLGFGKPKSFSSCQIILEEQLQPMECLVLSLLSSPVLAVYRSTPTGSVWGCCILTSVLTVCWMAAWFTLPAKNNHSVQTAMDLRLASSQDGNTSICTKCLINRHSADAAAGAQPKPHVVAENCFSTTEKLVGFIKEKPKNSSNGSDDSTNNNANNAIDFFEKVPTEDFSKNHPRFIHHSSMGMDKLGDFDRFNKKSEQDLSGAVAHDPKKVAKKIGFQDDSSEKK